MKKLFLYALIPLAVAGCNVGLKADDPNGPQPKFQLEQLESSSIEEATAQAIKDVQKRAPWLFQDQNNFVIGSALNQADYSKTYQTGRSIGAHLTRAIAAKKRARHVHFRENMIRVQPDLQGYIGVSEEATNFAQRIGADTLVVSSYEVDGSIITVHLNFIRAIDNYPLVQHSYQLYADEQTKKLAQRL